MKRHTKRIAGSLAMALGLASGTAFAQDDSLLTLGAGYEFTTGTYGTTMSTDIVTIPLSALYESGSWAVKLIVPYLQITGDGEVISSSRYGGMHGTSTTVTTVTKTRTTQSGLGDVVTMLTYNLYSGEDQESGVDLTGRVKFGTASKTLGTGKNDYAVQMFLYRNFGDFTPAVMFGYEMLGSTDQLPLNNVYYGSAGASYAFSDWVSVGAEYKYSQKASATFAEQRQATFQVDIGISENAYLRGYVLKGYSTGSPDSGYGLAIFSAF